MIVIDLIYNISVLVALSTLSGFINYRYDKKSLLGKVLQGILFGFIAVIGMLYPFNLSEGIIFDGRSIVISLCTLFFGSIPGIISSLIGIIFRNILGGGGALTGTLVILASFFIGLTFHNLWLKRKLELSNKILYIFGFLVSAAMMFIMITLPKEYILETVKSITLTVMTFYPIITLLIGKVLLDQEENKNYVNRLNQEKNLYKTTLYSIGDGIIVTDNNGIITQINQVAEKLTGWGEKTALGKHLEAVFYTIDENSRYKIENPVNRILEKSSLTEFPGNMLLISRDGKEIPVINSAAPIINNEGAVIGVVLVFRDQSDEREKQLALKQSEEKFRNLFENHVVVKLLIDPVNGNIIDANPAAADYYGYSREQLIQMNLCQIDQRYEEVTYKDIESPYNAKGQFECRHKLSDGTIRNVEVFNSIIDMNKKEIIHQIIIDITEKKKSESELEQYRKHLEKLVEQRTEELDRLNKNLSEQLIKELELEKQLNLALSNEKELNELKTRFIATVSHEFRTPLAALLSSAQMIQRYSSRWTEEKLNEHYNRISSTVNYLTQLLDDVLTISRADREILSNNPEKVNLKDLLNSFYQDLESTLNDSHKLVFNSKQEKDSIFIDKKLIRHIIINLLTNAIKYSPEGGKIELSIDYKEDYLSIIVSDEGIGIDEDEIKFIFDPFFRSKNAVGIQGSGLGLHIVLRSVEILGGNISVESKLNNGTKFLLRIPVYE